MQSLDAEQIIRLFNLQPLPVEGGWYYQTYRSPENIPDHIPSVNLPGIGQSEGSRPFATAIFYLLTNDPVGLPEAKSDVNHSSFSAFHRLRTDEIYHFYLGDPLEMTLLYPNGSSQQVILGQDVLNGQNVQYIVPHGVWQATRLVAGGRFALLGTVMAPGYTSNDYEHGERTALLAQYPHERERIRLLTR